MYSDMYSASCIGSLLLICQSSLAAWESRGGKCLHREPLAENQIVALSVLVVKVAEGRDPGIRVVARECHRACCHVRHARAIERLLQSLCASRMSKHIDWNSRESSRRPSPIHTQMRAYNLQYVYVCIYTYVYIMYMYKHVHICMCVHIYIRQLLYIHTRQSHVVYGLVQSVSRMYIFIYIYIYIHIFVYIHTRQSLYI